MRRENCLVLINRKGYCLKGDTHPKMFEVVIITAALPVGNSKYTTATVPLSRKAWETTRAAVKYRGERALFLLLATG
jgi:hypothetical protein